MIPAMVISSYFLLGFLVSLKTDKYAWVDFFWASSFALFVFTLPIWLPSLGASLLLLSGMYLLWSLRLSGLLFFRLRQGGEDPRYEALKTKSFKGWGLFLLYSVEALLVFVLSGPLYMLTDFLGAGLDIWNLAGLGVFLLALSGETLADRQKSNFRSRQENQGKVCNVGLWRYSRHPNYFFEIGVWFSFGVFNLGLNDWYWSFIPFLVMAFLISKVTGVPPSEEQSLKSRGESYKVYQQTTNRLIPWFPKEV